MPAERKADVINMINKMFGFSSFQHYNPHNRVPALPAILSRQRFAKRRRKLHEAPVLRSSTATEDATVGDSVRDKGLLLTVHKR